MITNFQLFSGNYSNINSPINLKVRTTGKFGDWVFGGYVGITLISDRLKTILEKYNFSGWKTYPVHITNSQGKTISGYIPFQHRLHLLEGVDTSYNERASWIQDRLYEFTKGDPQDPVYNSARECTEFGLVAFNLAKGLPAASQFGKQVFNRFGPQLKNQATLLARIRRVWKRLFVHRSIGAKPLLAHWDGDRDRYVGFDSLHILQSIRYSHYTRHNWHPLRCLGFLNIFSLYFS